MKQHQTLKIQMKLMIAGSRKLAVTTDNLELLKRALDDAHCHYSNQTGELEWPSEILHGGAPGGDELARRLADELNIPQQVIRPDFQRYNPKRAPLERNTELVAAADVVIAFYHPDNIRRGGTWDAARKAVERGKILIEVCPGKPNQATLPAPGLWP
ncbi:MAG: DUF2493 domain-containing protein [Phaeodactylibacter sp.]|nr:DUF2493 domain-containing protein [Phaeodactylibacter sp.]MCB9302604.1 DUF2493 domain-containing protein [Lewinellaceae bacterium]